jgi:hypothetical protein
MIPIQRGQEPGHLAPVRLSEQAKLIALGRPPMSDEITGYRCVADDLWKWQHHKCCYCEFKVKTQFNDVEHYRPKASASRGPGSTDTHGYWWLAHTWTNLFFACSSCNRTSKNDRFPLRSGSTALVVGQNPPGGERPLLLDPAGRINPVVHIEFEYRRALPLEPLRLHGPEQWFARARNRSVLGRTTIDVCGLNDPVLVELRKDHIENHVREKITDLENSIASGKKSDVQWAFARALGLLAPQNAFVALTYDALCQLVPNSKLDPWKLAWPKPREVGRPRTP